MKYPQSFMLDSYFDKHTAATPSYEVVSMNDIVSSTVNLNEAIGKYIDLSKPTPVVEEVCIRNDNGDVLQVAERTEPSLDKQPEF